MRKLREIDRLKVLLLDEDQRVVFDNLPKPDVMDPFDIENEQEKLYKIEKAKGRSNTNIVPTADDYYKKLASRQDKDIVDEKLIKWYQTAEY